MRRSAALFAIVLGFLLSACRSTVQQETETPTPFPREIAVQRVTTAAPIPITLQNLAANPDFFIGATLQLTGQYQRLPRLACQGKAYPSPATWGLVSEGFFAHAAGMDEQLRSLINEGQTIAVEGRWLKFEGLVGCDPVAEEQEIWYLSVDRILEPHPLVRGGQHAATPREETTTVAELPATEAPATLPPAPDVTATAPAQLTATSVAPATLDGATATITGIGEGTRASIPSPTSVGTAVTPMETMTPTFGAQDVNATATQTPNAGSGTATATPSQTVTPSSTETASIEEGTLETEDLIINSLAAGSNDSWSLDLSAGSMITITVVPADMVNIVLTLVDSNNTRLIDEQSDAPVGEVETIRDLAIIEPGLYQLLIGTEQDVTTDYALMVMDEESYSFVFRGRLTAGTSRSDTLAANRDHFWFFNAQNGDSISFTVTPDSDSDPYLELYDPQGGRMLTIDDTGDGEAEALNGYTLLEEGMYAVRVAEFDFRQMAYQILLTE